MFQWFKSGSLLFRLLPFSNKNRLRFLSKTTEFKKKFHFLKIKFGNVKKKCCCFQQQLKTTLEKVILKKEYKMRLTDIFSKDTPKFNEIQYASQRYSVEDRIRLIEDELENGCPQTNPVFNEELYFPIVVDFLDSGFAYEDGLKAQLLVLNKYNSVLQEEYPQYTVLYNNLKKSLERMQITLKFENS